MQRVAEYSDPHYLNRAGHDQKTLEPAGNPGLPGLIRLLRKMKYSG